MILYSYTSATVPVPPLAPLKVAESVWPSHTFPAAISGVIVAATGWATTVQVTVLYPEKLQPLPVAVLLDRIMTVWPARVLVLIAAV